MVDLAAHGDEALALADAAEGFLEHDLGSQLRPINRYRMMIIRGLANGLVPWLRWSPAWCSVEGWPVRHGPCTIPDTHQVPYANAVLTSQIHMQRNNRCRN